MSWLKRLLRKFSLKKLLVITAIIGLVIFNHMFPTEDVKLPD